MNQTLTCQHDRWRVCMAGLTAGHYCGLQASYPFQILYSSARKAQWSREKMSVPLIRSSGGLVSPPPSSPGIDSWSENSGASHQGFNPPSRCFWPTRNLRATAISRPWLPECKHTKKKREPFSFKNLQNLKTFYLSEFISKTIIHWHFFARWRLFFVFFLELPKDLLFPQHESSIWLTNYQIGDYGELLYFKMHDFTITLFACK